VENVLDIFEGHNKEYRALRICLMSRLWVHDTSNTGPLVKWLACVRESRAALLTTNYDTVLERGIGKLTTPVNRRPLRDRGLIDYGVAPGLLAPKYCGVARSAWPNSILLLKLHGSISWAFCETCKTGELDPAYRDLAGNALAGAENCANCSSLLSPVLVGPTKKQYRHPIIESIFRSAREALEQADEIVFAGFSLSPSDERIRELLAHARQIARTTRVFIVDQNSEGLRERYREVYGDAVQEIAPMDWRQYLLSIA
jgi:NAD-dependent SIR2 family protein deacetylase